MSDRPRPSVAVVTGASDGLGAGLAASFVTAGIRVGACARRPPTSPTGAEGLSASVDVTDPHAVQEFAELVVERLGPIDLWVNNAGTLGPVGPLRALDLDDFRHNLEVNLMGVVHGTRTFVRHRRSVGGGGVLVNVTSGAAQHGSAGWAAYCAAKAGVDRVTEVVALEEAGIGLRAYAVAPGLVDTPMQELVRSSSPEDFPTRQRFIDAKEHEAFNSPEHVAGWLLDLVGGDAAHDGGVVVRRVPDQVDAPS